MQRPEMISTDHVPTLALDQAIELIPIGLFQYRLLLMCGLAFMTEGFEITLLTFLTACAGVEWELSSIAKATLTGMVFIGIVVGSLFFGWLADNYGRRPAYLYACFLITVAGFLSAIAPSYWLLVLFRTVTGFGIGGATVPYDLIAEFLPTEHRGPFLVYSELFWTFGSMSVAGLAWGTLHTLGWRFLTFASALPVCFVSVYSYFHLPESPRWLLSKNRESEANQILRDGAALNGVHLGTFVLSHDAHKQPQEGSYVDLVATKEARRITFPIWAIWGLYGFTYYGLVIFEGRIFSNQDELRGSGNQSSSCAFDYGPIFYNSASEFAAVLISAALIDRIGRVHSQALFYTIAGGAMIAMGQNISPSLVLFFSIVARMGTMSGTVGTWVTTPELFPTDLRASGHSSCSAVSKLCSFCSPYLVTSLSHRAVGWILGLLSLAAAVTAHALPETSTGVLGGVTAGAREENDDKDSSPRPTTSLTVTRTLSSTTNDGAARRRSDKNGAYTQLASLFTLSYDEEDQSSGELAASTHSNASSVHGGGRAGGSSKYFEMANTMTRTRDRRSRSNSTEQREPLVVYNTLNSADD